MVVTVVDSGGTVVMETVVDSGDGDSGGQW